MSSLVACGLTVRLRDLTPLDARAANQARANGRNVVFVLEDKGYPRRRDYQIQEQDHVVLKSPQCSFRLTGWNEAGKSLGDMVRSTSTVTLPNWLLVAFNRIEASFDNCPQGIKEPQPVCIVVRGSKEDCASGTTPIEIMGITHATTFEQLFSALAFVAEIRPREAEKGYPGDQVAIVRRFRWRLTGAVPVLEERVPTIERHVLTIDSAGLLPIPVPGLRISPDLSRETANPNTFQPQHPERLWEPLRKATH